MVLNMVKASSRIIWIFSLSIFLLFGNCNPPGLVTNKKVGLVIAFGDHFVNDKVCLTINGKSFYKNFIISSSNTDGLTNVGLTFYESNNEWLVESFNKDIKERIPRTVDSIIIEVCLGQYRGKYDIFPSNGIYVNIAKGIDGKPIIHQLRKSITN
jgi:hypothetical protein